MGSQSIIRHLHDCCQADSHQQAIWNLLGSRIEHLHEINRIESVLEGTIDTIGMGDVQWLEATSRTLGTYRREKTLIAGFFPIVGRGKWGHPPRSRLCAPLLFCDAELNFDESRGAGLLTLKMNTIRPNATVLASLCDETLPKDQIDALLERIIEGVSGTANIYGLAYELEKIVPTVDWSALKDYPTLRTVNEVRAAQKKDGARCLPAVLTVVAPYVVAPVQVPMTGPQGAGGAYMAAGVTGQARPMYAQPPAGPMYAQPPGRANQQQGSIQPIQGGMRPAPGPGGAAMARRARVPLRPSMVVSGLRLAMGARAASGAG